MTDLLARLQAATEGSAELDAAVLRAAGWSKRDDAPQWNDQWGNWRDMKHPSRSLDAITELIEARRWKWESAPSRGHVEYVDADGATAMFGASHPSSPLALCIAFVRALETAA